MPITSSAKKELRASKRKRVFNIKRKVTLKETVKATKGLIKAKTKKEADKSLQAAFKAIDKAMKGGVIKKNTANRKKSRLAKAVAKIA
jgi:small subunit ribosomal protein S20